VGDGTVSVTNTVAITVTNGLPPVVTIVAATNMAEDTTLSVPFTVANVSSNYTSSQIAGVPSNTNLIASVGITGSGTNYTANITLVPHKSGNSTVSIATQDGFGIGLASLALTVTFVEYPPTLAPISNTNTVANVPVNVVLSVTDVATSISNLTYSAVINGTNVIQAVTFSFNGTNEVARVVPAANKTGIATITISVSDGVVTTNQAFSIQVTAPTPPTLGAIANVATNQNSTVQVVLSVTSPVTPVTNLTFTSTYPTNLVSSMAFSYNGTNEVAVITPVTNATGIGTVSITVTDPLGQSSSQSFTLQINSPTPPTLTVTLVSPTDVRITFTGTPGVTYTI